MDVNNKTNLSYYKTITAINELHNIFLVKHIESGKIYVKKVMDVYNSAVYKSLFENHIQGTPRIIDYEEDDNQLIVIEEYINGLTISEMIDSALLTKDKIIKYTMGLCDILAIMHSQKPAIIHRDIKPSNIIVTDYDEVFLIDFNAAKNYNKIEKNDTVLLGTEGYAAPEQYGFGASSPQTDVYAMGILLKEMLDSIDCRDERLLSIVDKCTKLEPQNRYGNIIVLKKDLSLVKDKKADDSETESESHKNIYTPPGFRTMRPWKMLIALLGYSVIFGISLTIDMPEKDAVLLWSDRIAILMIFLSTIACWFNYGDIQKLFLMCKSKSKPVHYFGVMLLDVFVSIAIMILLYIFQFAYNAA
ncbi:MAG: protein kinase [Lachnospiraceae bacterium]|nr:protein kinase [Lachnospiraceae bacterium]